MSAPPEQRRSSIPVKVSNERAITNVCILFCSNENKIYNADLIMILQYNLKYYYTFNISV